MQERFNINNEFQPDFVSKKDGEDKISETFINDS